MRELTAITKALADTNRLRVLHVLRDGELCACQIVEFLGLAGSSVSRHLAVLHRAGLVGMRKEGRWIHYRLADRTAPPAVRAALRWVLDSMAAEPAAGEDTRRLRSILRLDPATLCRRQGQRR